MKVLLINGSPHKEGCTYTALAEAAKALQAQGIQTQFVHLGTAPVHGCIACGKCQTLKRCVFEDDPANTWLAALREADGLIIGSPVYYAGPNGALCAVLDRMFYAGDAFFAGKPAAAVVSCRRGGSTAALDRLIKYFTVANMPVVSSQYWNMVHGTTPEEVRQDEEGMQIMRRLGTNMSWMLNALHKEGELPSLDEPPARTNFIR